MIRKYGQDYWQNQIQAWERSGRTQAQYCQDKGICRTSFSKWKNKLLAQSTSKTKDAAAFIPLTVAQTPTKLLELYLSQDGKLDLSLHIDFGFLQKYRGRK